VQIDALGAYTNGASPITVTLYDLTTSSVVATETITQAGADYAYDRFAAITLAAGDYQVYASGYDAANMLYNPDQLGGGAQAVFFSDGGKVVQGGAYYNLSPGTLATTFDVYTDTYGAGSVLFVPEPASWALMIGGAGLVGGFLRSRRRPALARA
jgi:hypothetical protein